MSDLIYRQAAIDAIRDHKRNVLGQREWDEGIAFGYSAAHEHICDIIKTLPTIDERKKGKWNFIGDQVFVCTECGACYSQSQFEYLRTRKSDPEFPYFCPMCGAETRGEKDE